MMIGIKLYFQEESDTKLGNENIEMNYEMKNLFVKNYMILIQVQKTKYFQNCVIISKQFCPKIDQFQEEHNIHII